MNRLPGNCSLFIVLCSLIIGCDNPINVREKIDEKVWEANAPAVRVYPNVRAGTGIITPSGVTVSGDAYLAKQHIAFDVSYNLTNTDYAFIRWEAHSGDLRAAFNWEGQQPGRATPGQIFISADKERPTSARVTSHLDSGQITLTPLVAMRPRVTSFQPDGGTSKPAVLNAPVVIQFSVPIKLSAISWGWQSSGKPQWKNAEGKFKNISITGRAPFGAGDPVSFEKYYGEPEIDDKHTILTFPVNMEAIYAEKPSFSHIYVELDANITAEDEYETTLGTTAHYLYAVEDQEDETGPVVTLIKGATKNLNGSFELIPPSSPITGEKIYLIISAYDAIYKTSLQKLQINYRGKTDTSFSTNGTISPYEFINRYNAAAYKDLQEAVERQYGKLPGVMYVIPYTLPSAAWEGILVPEIFDCAPRPGSNASPSEILAEIKEPKGNSSFNAASYTQTETLEINR